MTSNGFTQNPLLKASSLKNRALPFNEIKTEHFLPALEQALRLAREHIEQIKSQPNPNFKNTIEALEFSSDDLDLVAATFYNMISAHTSDELQEMANEFGPKTANFANEILHDADLFKRVEEVHNKRHGLNLTHEEERLLEETFSNFVRNGALLDGEKKKRLQIIDEELSKLGPQFSQNVLKATNAFELVIENKDNLAGLPESAIEAAAHAAEEKGHKGKWLVTLDAPSYIPFMKYSEKREIREKIYRSMLTRAYGNEFDNQENVLNTVKLRHERAQLLGYKTHADFVLKKRMAESAEKVETFLDRLLEKAKPRAKEEIQEIQEFAKTQGGPDELMPWDFSFYSEKFKEQKFKFHEEDLRPYFKLENVIDGVFEHAKRLYQLEFKLSDEYPNYHEDVLAYEVYDHEKNEFIGLFYADFFPRPNKKGGAWMTSYYDQGLFKGENMRPHVGIVCNFTKPTKSKPSLLTFQEVQTLFHEFGHALHGLLSHCRYRSLGGTNVYWDFVELPSQIMENWTFEKEGLDIFARHYETDQPIPADLAKKLQDSKKYLAGYFSVRQVSFAMLDMNWHHTDPDSITNVSNLEQSAMDPTRLLPQVDGTNVSCAFSHIFAGGYSAGYYSYKWAEVLDADAFEYFKDEGLFNKEVAHKFKENILSKGGTSHPMDLYRRFRGREPDPDAVLRRDGLL